MSLAHTMDGETAVILSLVLDMSRVVLREHAPFPVRHD